MANRPPPSYRGRHSVHQSQRSHKRDRDDRDQGPEVYRRPRLDGDDHLKQRLERALKREAEASARQRAVAEEIKITKATLSTFGIRDFGPNLSNLDLAEVARACKAETDRQNKERKQARPGAAADADTQDRTVEEETTEISDAKRYVTDVRGFDSVAFDAQATKVDNASDKMAEKENNVQGPDTARVSVTQQSNKDSAEYQMIKAETDNLIRVEAVAGRSTGSVMRKLESC